VWAEEKREKCALAGGGVRVRVEKAVQRLVP